MIVFAHAGHWLPQLLYLLPVVVLVGALVAGRLRERREGGDRDEDRRARDGDVSTPPSG